MSSRICAFVVAVSALITLGASQEKTQVAKEKKKPVRVLLVADGPSLEFQFLQGLLFRERQEKKAALTVFLTSPVDPKVDESVTVLKNFPARVQDLAAYDVVVALDADWTTLKSEQLEALQQWVQAGGGLIFAADKLKTPALAEQKNATHLKALLSLLPVVLKEEPRPSGNLWRLAFPDAKERPGFLRLGDGAGALDGWAEFFGAADQEPVRGFFDCYPLRSVRPGATVLATFGDPKLQLDDGKPVPFLATSSAGKGRVVYIGSTETRRLRPYREGLFYERFWTRLLSYANASSQTQPATVSTQPSLKIVRWLTSRRLTNFKPDEMGTIRSLKISGDGSKLLFATYKGIFVIGTEGASNPVALSAKLQGGVEGIDISERAETVAWREGSTLFVASGDGKGRREPAKGIAVTSFRLTASGDRLVFLAEFPEPLKRGIYTVPTDGSAAPRKIIDLADVQKVLGKANPERNFRASELHISEDGTRIVFCFGPDAFAVEGTGQGLRNLSEIKPGQGEVTRVRVSGNGAKVASHIAYPQPGQPGLTIMDWNGANRVVSTDLFFAGARGAVNALEFARDGSRIAASGGGGLRFYFSDGPVWLDVTDWGNPPTAPLADSRGWTITSDASRACAIIGGPASTGGSTSQLALVDLSPRPRQGPLQFKNIEVEPRTLPVDGARGAVLRVQTEGADLKYVGVRVWRPNDSETRFTYYGNMPLNDEGQQGDEKAKDGIFTTNQLQLYRDIKPVQPGPLVLRVFAYNSGASALMVDVEEVSASPPERVHPNQNLLPGGPVESGYSLGRSLNHNMKHPAFEENFMENRERHYIRPRAYPHEHIDHNVRLQARQQLNAMRINLNRPHVQPGWLDRAQPPMLGTVPQGGPCAWVSVGPTNINGRITSIAIDPTNKQNLFVTTVGGVWRSRDAGRRWQRVSDSFVSGVCASVVINPRNTSEIFVGTGDPNYTTVQNRPWGRGIWRSSVSGEPGSWSKISSAEMDNLTIYRLRIDPETPNNLYAATSAGIYLGTRSGADISWSRLKDFDAWTTDFVVDFTATPRKVYAGVARGSARFGVGIWKFDGNTWQKRDTGIPTTQARTIALAQAASNSNILYAKVENGTNGNLLGVYKTTTAAEPAGTGNAWISLPTRSTADNLESIDGSNYCWYNSMIEVDPRDANTVYFGGVYLFRSTDGGMTWKSIVRGGDPNYRVPTHADNHALAFDPDNSKTIHLASDGGLYQAANTFDATWHWRNVSHGMIITEFYRITTQQARATILAGGTQDNGTVITFGNRTWYNPFGCDGADVAIDAENSMTMYLNCNSVLHELANPVPGTPGSGTGSEIKWVVPAGFAVSSPIVTDPARAGAALAAGSISKPPGPQRLLKTANGVNWTFASPDLPGGARVSFIAIAPSSAFQTYYVGLDAKTPTIWRTTDGGNKWSTTATGLPANLRPNGIAVDNIDPTRAVAVFGGDAGGGVYLTTDGGATWNSLLGSGPGAYPARAVATGVVFDPFDPNVVYVASHIGVFKGQIKPGATPTATWIPFDEGLVNGVDVNDICVNRAAGLLTIGTMGHGAYQRDINPKAKCPAVKLVVRDNVFDRGLSPSTPAGGYPDPEHPVRDPARPGFFKPGDPIYWWTSPDIRIDVPSQDSPANQIPNADHVEFETTPIRITPALPGTLMDSNPIRGSFARAYIQVNNRGLQPASNVRVMVLYADATAGLPALPADFWLKTFPAGSTTCGPLNPASGWRFVDPANPCKVIPVVNPAVPEVIGFDWNVPANLADHSCMLAIVDSLDDPIEANIRTANETRPWVFVPNSRHIGLRNLHVVTVTTPQKAQPQMILFDVPNHHPTRNTVEVSISRGTVSPGGMIALVIPKGDIKLQGFKTSTMKLSDEHRKLAAKWNLHSDAVHVLHEKDAHITHLPVPAGQTGKIGVIFHRSPEAVPGSASRFTIITRDGQTVLGGSTIILRTPPAPPKTPSQ